MTAEEAAYIMMSGGTSYEEEDKSITENGVYIPAANVRWKKVTVTVPTEPPDARIGALVVSENGIYHAADYGLDGFDPVNVNSPYENLYKQEHNLLPGLETDITDPNGNPVTIPGAVGLGSLANGSGNPWGPYIEAAKYPGGWTSVVNTDLGVMFTVNIYHDRFDRNSDTIILITTNLHTGQKVIDYDRNNGSRSLNGMTFKIEDFRTTSTGGILSIRSYRDDGTPSAGVVLYGIYARVGITNVPNDFATNTNWYCTNIPA